MKRLNALVLASLLLPCALCQGASLSGSASQRYTIENGFFRLSGAQGSFDHLSFDPKGKGHFGASWIKSLYLGDLPTTPSGPMRWELASTHTLHLLGAPVGEMHMRQLGGAEEPFPLWPQKRLGQRFRVTTGALYRVTGKFPTWSSRTSGFTLKLRRKGSDGEILAQKRFENVADDSEQGLEFAPPLPPGLYYLEMSEPVGSTGWRMEKKRPSEEESAFITGGFADEAIEAAFLTHIYTSEPASADWEIRLEADRLSWKVSGTSTPKVCLSTPWMRDGYDTNSPQATTFRYFTNDWGMYRPVHQFKRRDRQEMPVAQWAEMTGTSDFNLRFEFPSGGKLVWQMESDKMNWLFERPELSFRVLPHSEALSDAFPVFFSSDTKMDALLNQFFYSHGLNFGVGCPPDWAEWQARIFCWTKSPLRAQQANHFTPKGYKLRPDGYVHTWGDQEGWPFPSEDKDKDGKNDFDTRHFTTNPDFVLGAARHALWSRDRGYVQKVLPRARKAMEFMLTELQGEKGIVLITAKGHDGTSNAIGSNYWDILPFGNKDAYTNVYYYGSLEAMAQLEELARQIGLGEGGRSPEFYRQLRDKARKDYQASFWNEEAGRFVGCVDTKGEKHDFGFTFVNIEAMAYGLADPSQVKRIYLWMEGEPTASGKADCYSRWIFAPRASTLFNPPHDLFNLPQGLPKAAAPSWWHFGWRGTPYDEQCQAGGAILYTSGYDVLARARFLGADNAYKRLSEILARYAMPDHLSGGSPLYRGERSQGPDAGSVGVESEFPESGLVPASFLYAFLGVDADAQGLKVRPNLPSALGYAGVRNLSYAGKTYELRVSRPNKVSLRCTDAGSTFSVQKTLGPGESFCLKP